MFGDQHAKQRPQGFAQHAVAKSCYNLRFLLVSRGFAPSNELPETAVLSPAASATSPELEVSTPVLAAWLRPLAANDMGAGNAMGENDKLCGGALLAPANLMSAGTAADLKQLVAPAKHGIA